MGSILETSCRHQAPHAAAWHHYIWGWESWENIAEQVLWHSEKRLRETGDIRHFGGLSKSLQAMFGRFLYYSQCHGMDSHPHAANQRIEKTPYLKLQPQPTFHTLVLGQLLHLRWRKLLKRQALPNKRALPKCLHTTVPLRVHVMSFEGWCTCSLCICLFCSFIDTLLWLLLYTASGKMARRKRSQGMAHNFFGGHVKWPSRQDWLCPKTGPRPTRFFHLD